MNIAQEEQNDEDEYDSESDYSESEVIGSRQEASASRDQEAGYRGGPGMNIQWEYEDESDEEDSEELIDNGAHDHIEEDDDIEELGTQFNEQFVN